MFKQSLINYLETSIFIDAAPKPKAVFFSIGTIFKRNKLWFSESVAEKLNLNYESEVLPFINGDFQECLIGKLDLKEILPNWLFRWNYPYAVDDFLDLWFTYENEFYPGFLDLIEKLRLNNVKVGIATKQEKYRMAYLEKHLSFSSHFDYVFATCDLKIKKANPDFYREIQSRVKIKDAKEILLLDETEGVETAKLAGWQTKFVDSQLFR